MYTDDRLLRRESQHAYPAACVRFLTFGNGQRWREMSVIGNAERLKQRLPIRDLVVILGAAGQNISEKMCSTAEIVTDAPACAREVGDEVAANVAPRVEGDIEVAFTE